MDEVKKRRLETQHFCKQCGAAFFRYCPPSLLARGHGFFCNRACFNAFNAELGIEKRFLKKVVKSDGCWEWNGFRNPDGYGVVKFRDRLWRTHRVAWVIYRGEIPEGLCVLHRCDNAACVRPDHLFIGTQGDNAADRDSKGRHKPFHGSDHPRSKILEEDVLKMRSLFKAGSPIFEIAKLFPVISYDAVCKIVHSKLWKHVKA